MQGHVFHVNVRLRAHSAHFGFIGKKEHKLGTLVLLTSSTWERRWYKPLQIWFVTPETLCACIRNGSMGRGQLRMEPADIQLWIRWGRDISESRENWHKVAFILMVIQLFLKKDKTKVRKIANRWKFPGLWKYYKDLKIGLNFLTAVFQNDVSTLDFFYLVSLFKQKQTNKRTNNKNNKNLCYRFWKVSLD